MKKLQNIIIVLISGALALAIGCEVEDDNNVTLLDDVSRCVAWSDGVSVAGAGGLFGSL
jgi:hypothetical protein